jgi:hypothetical protein
VELLGSFLPISFIATFVLKPSIFHFYFRTLLIPSQDLTTSLEHAMFPNQIQTAPNELKLA